MLPFAEALIFFDRSLSSGFPFLVACCCVFYVIYVSTVMFFCWI